MKQKTLRKTITLLFLAVIATSSLAACASDNDDGSTTVVLPKFLCALFFGLFGDDNIGLAGGTDGRMARTEDGGQTWTKVNTGIDYAIKDVAFETGGRFGVGVGEMGKTIRTEDGGLTWQEVVAGAANNLNAVAVRGTKYWAAGDGGALYFSNDRGKTWAHQDSGTTENLNGVCFTHESQGTQDRGWAVGNNGTVVGTFDGTTWQDWPTGVTVDLRGCFNDFNPTFSSSFSLAWGNKGTLLESLDFGQNFNQITTTTVKDLYALQLKPSPSPGVFTRTGILVGDGIALKTSDFGSTWKTVIDEIQFGPFGLLKAVTFMPNGRVDAVGADDVHFQSQDDGENWQLRTEIKLTF